ncbi:hypothetical protein [Maribellus mangrovi]|uniref:hypothetical protein n=1 Tax=Maribellus mangrovi TaxID=3133146 RepID=UPI0030ED5305
MKTIYQAIIARLADQVPALKWTDMNIGQLDSAERPAVMLPCALISIKVTKAKSLTDTIQDCEAQVTVTLAFDVPERTSGNAPAVKRMEGLAVYDIIADTYAALQGWGTENFDSLSRTSQGEGTIKNGTFRYPVTFSVQFEDNTAN